MSKTKLCKDVVKGDTIKVWVDSDFFGKPLYNVITATDDAVDLSNENVLSGYGVHYGEKGLMFIADGQTRVEILEGKS